LTSLQRALDSDASHQEIAAVQRRPPPKLLTQIAEAHGRDEAIFDVYASGGYSLKGSGIIRTALLPNESHCETAAIDKQPDLIPVSRNLLGMNLIQK
jgi:hypothetical protein